MTHERHDRPTVKNLAARLLTGDWKRGSGQSFTAQTLSLIAGRGLGKLMNFAGFLLLARALGPAAYGGFTFAFSLASILVFLPNMGVDGLFSRQVARGHEPAREILGTMLVMKAAGSLIYIPLFLGIIYLSPTTPAARDGAAAVAVALVLLSFWVTWSTVLITASRAHVAGVLEVIAAAVFLSLCATWVYQRPSVVAASMAFLAGQVVLFAVGGIVSLGPVGRLKVPVDRRTYLRVLGGAAPFLLIWFANNLYYKIDATLLYYFRGDAETGLYSAAYRLLEGLLAVAIVVGSTALPRLTRAWTRSANDFKVEWRRGFRLLCWVTVVPSLALVAAPGVFIEVLFGSSFVDAASSLRLLGVGGALLCLGTYFGFSLTATGLEWAQLRITAIALAVNVVLNLVCIPIAGGQGAALATVLAGAVYLALANRTLRSAHTRTANSLPPRDSVVAPVCQE